MNVLAAVGPLLPQLIVAFTGAAVLTADLVRLRPSDHGDGRPGLAYVGIGGLGLAAVAAVATSDLHGTWFDGTVAADPLATFFNLLFIAIAVVVLAVSIEATPSMTRWPAEFYALVLWCTAGNMLVAPAAELVTLFVALQLTSLPLIVLIAFDKRDPRSREASLKYLMLVLISTALFLYGLSLVYGATGTTRMAGVGDALRDTAPATIIVVGLALMLAGAGFKTTAAPFQQWAPDVYEGAPTPVTALLSVGSKAAGFALVLRFAVTGLGASADVGLVFAVLAAGSMLIGNLGAFQQTNIKRLLAYSGVAQAGYILVGLAAMTATGISAVLFYLAAYAIGNLLAFAVVIGLAKATGSEDVSDYTGLVRRSPLAAGALTIALLSLAGLPLTVGFMAKFYVFIAAAEAGLLWLVVIAVLNTVTAFYYYLRIIWNLYVQESDAAHLAMPGRLSAVMTGCALGVVAVGVFPGPLMAAVADVAAALFGG